LLLLGLVLLGANLAFYRFPGLVMRVFTAHFMLPVPQLGLEGLLFSWFLAACTLVVLGGRAALDRRRARV
jgi:hypothetical protein